MKSLLFICVENRARSQIAEGLARHFIGHQYNVYSAGSQPTDRVHPMAVAVMAEIGVDISSQKPKPITSLDLTKIDTAIFLCEDDACPVLPTNIQKLRWPTTDPTEAQVETPEDLLRKFRKVRDELRKRVLSLRASDQTW